MHTLLILLAALPTTTQEDRAAQQEEKALLTLEQASGRGEPVSFAGQLERWSWAPDGVHLVRGRGAEARWIDPLTFEESAPPADEPGEEAATADEAIAAVDEKLAALAELAQLSPDEQHVAFVTDNNLRVLTLESQRHLAVTSDGNADVFNGKLDWVYQEEVYGRGRFRAFWWSPDSTRIAFLRLDESDVHDFFVIDHIEDGHFRVKPEVTRYPKAGDPNPTVKLGVADVASGAITWIDMERYADVEPLIVRVDWTPEGELMFMVQDRIQSWLDLNVVPADGGEVRTLLHESSGTWTSRARAPHWFADGSFLWESERTGYKHLYHHAADGRLITQVTRGDWQVRAVRHVDEESGRIWFDATRDGAINANLYRVNLDGSDVVRLTHGDGSHSVTFNEDRTLLLDRWSSLTQPPRVVLCEGDGTLLDELAESDLTERDGYLTSEWELHEIAARDGFALDVAVLKPVPFDPLASYPVWLPTYSGPNAPSVRNRWSASTWNQFLAQHGVIVLQVNVRSASGKGHYAASRAYQRLGVMELRDLEDAVAWLTANPWADAERVGITGGSYGGFMSAYALTHGDVFALGIAASGVYDWGMYDTIYTERYMSTPQLNPKGYEDTSVIAAAADLQGHLILTHGVMDDNVHLQNVLQLVYALQKADRPFELMLYPQNRHGIRDKDLRWFDRQLRWKAIREHLLRDGEAPTAPLLLEAAAPGAAAD